HLILPAAGRLWITPRIVAALEAEGDRASGPAPLVNASTYREDSLVFMTRGRVMHHDPADAGAALAGAGSGLDLMDAEAFDRLAAVCGERGVGRVHGYNYSSGREVELVIVQPGPGSPSRYRTSRPTRRRWRGSCSWTSPRTGGSRR